MARPFDRLLVLAAFATFTACGGQVPAAGGIAKPDLDADPLALLPASAVVVARLDSRAVYRDQELGAQVAAITDPLVPIGDGSWFQASRDVDQVVVGVYATPVVEVAAVLSGRFDIARIAQATRTKSDAIISTGAYAGFVTSSVGRLTWVALTPKTLISGTSEGVRFVLDRLQKGPPARSLPPWIVETLQTPGAAIALTADFVSQPVAAATFGNANLPWLRGLRIARVIGNVQSPGLNVAGTVTYGDPSLAQD